MYTPAYFSVPAKETLLEILPEASFATLLTAGADGLPEVTHLPVSYDPDRGDLGTITAHMAKANPHWEYLQGNPSMVIFQGPHTYISPRDYASTVNVPTWNYVAVHARGQAVLLEGYEQKRAVLKQLTSENEQGRSDPWSLDDMEERRLEAMSRAIVAFDIPVTDLQAKAKLGQNKSAGDKEALAAALEGSDMERWQKSIL